MRFWSLPGPQSFCNRVEDQLRDYKNILIALPNPAPPGFVETLCGQLDRSGWDRLTIQAKPTATPADFIFEQLELETKPIERRTASLLSKRLEPGQIVIIDDISTEDWLLWKRFLSEYEFCCRAIQAYERPLLIVIVKGISESALLIGAITLGVTKWYGILSELDMLSYAGARVREKGLEGIHAQLIATMVARLAQWDVAAADVLLEASIHDLFSPHTVLKELAVSYGWTKQVPKRWENGVMDVFNGSLQVHSAFLTLEDPTCQLNMRIWSSQASSLLPLIELHRRALLPKIRYRLKFPILVGGEIIHDASDLEIGSLAYLASQIQVDAGTRAKLRKLRNVRNALAHLDVLDANTALDPDLLNLNS